MKTNLMVFVLIIFLFTESCKQEIFRVPAVETISVVQISESSARAEANVTDDGGTAVTARGFIWNTEENFDLSSNDGCTTDSCGTGNYCTNLENLLPAKKYYVKAYATNSTGTGYSNIVSFNTWSEAPIAITEAATDILYVWDGRLVKLNGIVTPKGLTTAVSFEYGTSPDYGQTVEAVPATLSGDTSTQVYAKIFGMELNTLYYFRIKAVNAMGTVYGNEQTFTLWMNYPGPQVTDIDGNTYNSVRIGSQIWMTENLKVTRYRNGDPILKINDSLTWVNNTIGAYCDYNYDSTLAETYGHLYNFHAVEDSRKLCPAGWHVPSFDVWLYELSYFLDPGGSRSNLLMKEAGTAHWVWDTGATNVSGFTALPGGYFDFQNTKNFKSMGYMAYWWSSRGGNLAWAMGMYDVTQDLFFTVANKNNGYSVRCVKDE